MKMDVSALCRSCMEEVASWERDDVDKKTIEMFSFCTNIEIPKEDQLPKNFCYNCIVLIESSYAYIRKARRINCKLKKLVQHSGNNFVDNLLNKATSLEAGSLNEKVDKILCNFVEPDKIIDNNNDFDHDIFDDDDDKCLSEFKTVIKTEPIDVDNLTNQKPCSTLTATVEAPGIAKKLFKNKKCHICNKNFAKRGWYSRHMKTAHLKEIDENEAPVQGKEQEDTPINDSEEKLDAAIREGESQWPEVYLLDREDSQSQSELPVQERETRQPDEPIQKREEQTDVTMDVPEVPKLKLDKIKKKKAKKKLAGKVKKLKEDCDEEVKCNLCFKVFSSRHARSKHLHGDHAKTVDGKRVYMCPYCPKTYSKYAHMYYHATSHPEVSKHPCETCGKTYRIRKELEQHIRTHAKERPYACDQCDMRFKVKGVLVMHLKWHEGVRPFLCSICGRSFLQSGNLESHMRVHTGERPFACSLCSFRSTSRVSRKRHELRHSGDRPYPCTHCPKRFYEACSLTRHIRSHTRERPYHCPFCSRDFYDSGKRRRHFINIHKMAADEIPPMDKSGAPIERTAQNGPKRNRIIE